MMAAAGFPPPTPETPTKVVPKLSKSKAARICMVCGSHVVSIGSGYFTKGYTEKGKSKTLEERVKVIVETGPDTEDHTLHSDYMCKQCFRIMVKLEVLKEQQSSFIAQYWDCHRRQHRQHESTKDSLTPTRMKRMSGSPGAGTKRLMQDVARPASASGAIRRRSLNKDLQDVVVSKTKVIMK